MKFMLMCCFEERRWNALPEAERERVMTEYERWIADLDSRGAHELSLQLKSVQSATTVRVGGARPVLTDGPFAETREQLGGFHLIDAENLDAALAIAGRVPTLPVGGAIEVRPVQA